MPDTHALEAAAQSLKQQMEDCPVDGKLEEPVQKLVVKLFTDLHTGSLPSFYMNDLHTGLCC